MNKYTILKWEKLLLWLVPPILRKKTHVHWLNVLIAPLQSLYEDILYKMQHTGQVIYLEKVLNEAFNITKKYDPNLSIQQKRLEGLIYIDESVKPSLQYVYLHKEYYEDPNETLRIPQLKVFKNDDYKNKDNKPVYLAHRSDYTQVNYANFRVFMPKFLITNKTIDIETNENSFKSHSEAIKIATREYHDLLNFYKLAGKSYESYSY
ncbi:hypothetical protein [Flavobacterium sp. UBA7680]|uniref:hypothetical protein n=1 Tax=Flavobacterium sp. UBA7680 TaxID=1946559 RepID=UPI0025BBA3C1|nr:hypothetical protein [Flavobacterium sp. UBA7680]